MTPSNTPEPELREPSFASEIMRLNKEIRQEFIQLQSNQSKGENK